MTIQTGWTIRSETSRDRMAFWWYGPQHGFGNTWGGPDLAKTWPTKKAAEFAASSVFGAGWKRDLKRDLVRQAQKIEDAVAEVNERRAAIAPFH